jgi:hypothetical protein
VGVFAARLALASRENQQRGADGVTRERAARIQPTPSEITVIGALVAYSASTSPSGRDIASGLYEEAPGVK